MFIRTVYYVDIGNLPKSKAETYLADFLEKVKEDHTAFDRPFVQAVRNPDHVRVDRFFVPENAYDVSLLVSQDL
jgi:hypothetical protein